VDISRLVPAKKQEEAQHVTVSYLSRSTQDQMRQRNLNFKQEIDIRGMRGEEALQAITYYIDDAILVGASRVRILHGTGNGILRQLIRQYLSTVPAVRSAHDEHVQLGGAGITVVELS
jgi:DNA mismatch repair protein MutS2